MRYMALSNWRIILIAALSLFVNVEGAHAQQGKQPNILIIWGDEVPRAKGRVIGLRQRTGAAFESSSPLWFLSLRRTSTLSNNRRVSDENRT